MRERGVFGAWCTEGLRIPSSYLGSNVQVASGSDVLATAAGADESFQRLAVFTAGSRTHCGCTLTQHPLPTGVLGRQFAESKDWTITNSAIHASLKGTT
jgi:hypothetical protein